MTLKEEQVKKIIEKYGLSYCELEEACDCIHDLLWAESNMIKNKRPYATQAIKRTELAAYAAYDLGSDISCGNYDEKFE